jgi:hypothetical protein
MDKDVARTKALEHKIDKEIDGILTALAELDITSRKSYNTGDLALRVFRLKELWGLYPKTILTEELT